MLDESSQDQDTSTQSVDESSQEAPEVSEEKVWPIFVCYVYELK